MMRFLVDESSGRAIVEHLRALGHDVVAVAEVMPPPPRFPPPPRADHPT